MDGVKKGRRVFTLRSLPCIIDFHNDNGIGIKIFSSAKIDEIRSGDIFGILLSDYKLARLFTFSKHLAARFDLGEALALGELQTHGVVHGLRACRCLSLALHNDLYTRVLRRLARKPDRVNTASVV